MSLFPMNSKRSHGRIASDGAAKAVVGQRHGREVIQQTEPSISVSAFARPVLAGAFLVTCALIAGCGNGYRPVVSPINPSGPAAQPSSLVAVVSSPSPTTPGVATILDYAGDTIMAQAPIGPGPTTFTLSETGATGYTVNSDGTLTNFPASTSLQEKYVNYTTLPSSARPFALFSPSASVWVSDLSGNLADILTSSPATFTLSVPVAATPVAVVGPSVVGERNYAITQGAVTSPVACNVSPTTGSLGEADAIETTSYTISARIPLGKCPVYAIQTPDARRMFVLNRGDDTISVINTQNNTLDACTPFVNQSGQTVTCHPSLPLSTTAGLTGANVPAIAGPVYAEFNQATSQLVVADYDGGTVSVIDVSLDEYGNDSSTFGTTFTIPVGTTATPNPASVTVLFDGSRAYTANQNEGTVTILNLTSHTVEKTLPVTGHPRTVVSTQNSSYGKVYVGAPDSPYVTILRTDQDIIDATVLVEGNVVDVRVTTVNGSSGNPNNISRNPGYGEPCNLATSQLNPTSPNVLPGNLTLAQCQSQTAP